MRSPVLVKKLGPLLALALVLSACAEKEMAFTLPLNEERVVPVQVGGSAFLPSTIQASQGDRLLLLVANEGNKTHYLTVKNPRGEFIRSVVLPAGETVEVPLLLTEEGVWRFYGEKPLQGALNIRGHIWAAPRQ